MATRPHDEEIPFTPSLSRAARGARASALVVGGSARGRQRVAEALHAVGRTAGGPLLLLEERLGIREVLLRLLTRGIDSFGPATLYVDRAECLEPETRALVRAVLDLADDHWNAVPGRRDGLRLIAGVRSERRLDPALATGLGVLCVAAADADTAGLMAALGTTAAATPSPARHPLSAHAT